MPGPAAPRPQQGFLYCVLGIVERRQHPIAVHVQLALVSPGQFCEGRLIARDGSDNEPVHLVRRWHHCGRASGLTSCTSQPLPSGSVKERKEL